MPARTAAALSRARMPMAGGFAGAGRVGSEDEASDGEQRRVDIGFAFERVQGGAADLAGAKCCDQRGFVDDATAGGLIRYAVGFMARRAAAFRW